MPIKIPNDLPARQVLDNENIFAMTECRALKQDIRPLQIIILNLMPTKITTETQLLRCLSNTPLQIEIELLQMQTHKSKNTPEEHLLAFYKGRLLARTRAHHGVEPHARLFHLPYLLGRAGRTLLSLRRCEVCSAEKDVRRLPAYALLQRRKSFPRF